MSQEPIARSSSAPLFSSAPHLPFNNVETDDKRKGDSKSTTEDLQNRAQKSKDPLTRKANQTGLATSRRNRRPAVTSQNEKSSYEIWRPPTSPGDNLATKRHHPKKPVGIQSTNPMTLALQRFQPLGTEAVDVQSGRDTGSNDKPQSSASRQSSSGPPESLYGTLPADSEYGNMPLRTWHDWSSSSGTHRPSPPHRSRERGQNESPENPKVEAIADNETGRSMGADVAIALTRGILGNKLSYKTLLNCRGEKAQKMLNRLQELLYNPRLTDEAFKNHLLTAILRLCDASGMYPQCLTLRDIHCENDPVTAGHFGEIRRGLFRDQLVCLKVVKLYQKSQIDHLTKNFTREAILWSQLSHPNLLPFYGIYKLGDTNGRVCLVSPWMENGNISEYLEEKSEAPRMRLIYEIVTGLVHLHTKQIAHGDLKGTNIMITSTGSACLADFGLSSVVDTDILRWTSLETATRTGGTTRWLAPELLEEENSKLVKPTLASDVFALASVMYEVLANEVPFYEYPREATVIFKIVTGVKPSRPSFEGLELTNRIWELMELCWSFNPANRPGVANFSKSLQQIPLNRLSKKRMEKAQQNPNHSNVKLFTPTSFQAAMCHGEKTRVDFSESDLELLEELISGANV